MSKIWKATHQLAPPTAVEVDFERCAFLRPNAVVFLAAWKKALEMKGVQVTLLHSTMRSNVARSLLQNGFAAAMWGEESEPGDHAIRFRHDESEDKEAIVDGYLKGSWLGRGWVHVSELLANRIAGQVWEIYANAFEHGRSTVGIYSCGHHYGETAELLLAVGDLGPGVPANVRKFLGRPMMEAKDAMHWAFSRGNSTAHSVEGADVARGLGLDLLKEFVKINGGKLEIYSHDGYAKIDTDAETYETITQCFPATIILLHLACDEKRYVLVEELSSAPFF